MSQGWVTLKDGRRVFINNYMNNKIKKEAKKDYMWHGSSEENIENIKDYGFRNDKITYFATNEQIVNDNYGKNKIMLKESDFNLKDITYEVQENVFPTNSMRNLAKKEGYDGIKYKTSKNNYDIEILNNSKLNQILNETERENLEISKMLGGNLTEREKKRLDKLRS